MACKRPLAPITESEFFAFFRPEDFPHLMSLVVFTDGTQYMNCSGSLSATPIWANIRIKSASGTFRNFRNWGLVLVWTFGTTESGRRISIPSFRWIWLLIRPSDRTKPRQRGYIDSTTTRFVNTTEQGGIGAFISTNGDPMTVTRWRCPQGCH